MDPLTGKGIYTRKPTRFHVIPCIIVLLFRTTSTILSIVFFNTNKNIITFCHDQVISNVTGTHRISIDVSEACVANPFAKFHNRREKTLRISGRRYVRVLQKDAMSNIATISWMFSDGIIVASVNPYSPRDAYIRRWARRSLVQLMPCHLGPFLQTQVNLNPSMDKLL